MSLRKSPRLTSQQIAANRHNAQLSTGPRTPEGKARSRWNALKRRPAVLTDAAREAMRALGEDPAEFERLYRELLGVYAPSDPLWGKQVEDLARLYWRRARLDRAREGLIRQEIEILERDLQHRRKEIGQVAFAPSEHRLIEISVPRAQGHTAKLRQALSYLEVIRQRVAQRDFTGRLAWVFREYCGEEETWRINLIESLLSRFARDNQYATRPAEGDYPKLVNLLEEETARVREALEAAEREGLQVSPSERDACLAPTGNQWALVIRQENALDRAIDRKVRILMELERRRTAQGPGAEVPPDGYAAGDEPQETETVEADAGTPSNFKK